MLKPAAPAEAVAIGEGADWRLPDDDFLRAFRTPADRSDALERRTPLPRRGPTARTRRRRGGGLPSQTLRTRITVHDEIASHLSLTRARAAPWPVRQRVRVRGLPSRG